MINNVWTEQQKNNKPTTNTKSRNTPYDELPTTSKIKSNGMSLVREASASSLSGHAGQGRYTQNTSTIANLSHKFNNAMQLSDAPGGSSMILLNQDLSVMRRTSTQSAAPSQVTHLQNSHGNYVEIDAIDSILYQAENENLQQYENHIQSMLDITNNSPIYENQTSVRRSESPIYSNTHNQSVATLYPKTQNLYSNVPAITASGSSSNVTYANLQQSK